MRMRTWTLLVAVILAVCGGTAAARRIPCEDILSRVNHLIGVNRGGGADLSKLATQMGTTTGWVEHCMSTYGRRERRAELQSGEHREERLEQFEEEEPEETAPEDIEEPGEHEREVVLPERQRNLHIGPTPKPDVFNK